MLEWPQLSSTYSRQAVQPQTHANTANNRSHGRSPNYIMVAEALFLRPLVGKCSQVFHWISLQTRRPVCATLHFFLFAGRKANWQWNHGNHGEIAASVSCCILLQLQVTCLHRSTLHRRLFSTKPCHWLIPGKKLPNNSLRAVFCDVVFTKSRAETCWNLQHVGMFKLKTQIKWTIHQNNTPPITFGLLQHEGASAFGKKRPKGEKRQLQPQSWWRCGDCYGHTKKQSDPKDFRTKFDKTMWLHVSSTCLETEPWAALFRSQLAFTSILVHALFASAGQAHAFSTEGALELPHRQQEIVGTSNFARHPRMSLLFQPSHQVP